MYSKSHITLVSSNVLSGTCHPVSSKSESNRALILRELSDEDITIKNLSESNDTNILVKNLERIREKNSDILLNAEDAGTVMRFLTAFCACTPGEYTLTGSARMLERPLEPLVKTLQQLGADIEYITTPGHAPLRIHGKKLPGGKATITAGTSSQFISALLMCAPYFINGLELTIEGHIVSQPYINLTVQMMASAGVKVDVHDATYTVRPGKYISTVFAIESDWSAASYFYSLVALSQQADIFLEGYYENSMQGDSVVQKMYSPLGVNTTFQSEGIRLTKKAVSLPGKFEFNFLGCPDLAQTLAVTCACLQTEATLTGLSTLSLKETNRLVALQNELKKFNCQVEITGNDILQIRPGTLNYSGQPICTYNDHRMAMSFTAAVQKCSLLQIENPGVVNKSYPGFWDDVKKTGITVK